MWQTLEDEGFGYTRTGYWQVPAAAWSGFVLLFVFVFPPAGFWEWLE